MSSEDPAWLREQAKRCRLLAATTIDHAAADTLRVMAHDFERKATEVARAVPPSTEG